MDGFRRRRRTEGMPPAWTDMSAFTEVRWAREPVEWRHALMPILGSNPIDDNRGLFLTTEELMHRRLLKVLGWVREMLGLEETEGWRGRDGRPTYPPYLVRLLSRFFQENGTSIAWVMVESCRDSIRDRHPNLTESLLPGVKPKFGCLANRIEDRTQLPLRADATLSTDGLMFVLPRDRTGRDAHFTQMEVQRKLATETRPLFGFYTTWCFAAPDDEPITRGAAPAGMRYPFVVSVNPARLMTWLKLDLSSGWTYSYAIDIHEGTGEIFSVRYAKVTLEMQIKLDPWVDDWLIEALTRFRR